MSASDREQLRAFRQDFLDYVEGVRDTRPSLDELTDSNRLVASRWIASLDAARGVDPYASRPSTADLLARSQDALQRQGDISLAKGLEDSLRRSTDSGSTVVFDAASGAAGLAPRLVVHALGLRLRIIIDASLGDPDDLLLTRAGEFLSVFGAFPDTAALIIATPGPGSQALVVDRYDIVPAFETPSGAYMPPRAKRAIADLFVACDQFIAETLPAFRPFEYAPFAVPDRALRSFDLAHVAKTAVTRIAESGRRARLPAKRAAWGELADSEATKLSALLDLALRHKISEVDYVRHLDEIVEAA